MIPQHSYDNYLRNLKNKLYKALCLYEEKNSTFNKYFESLIYIEIHGLQEWIQYLPHDIWYVETLSRLSSLADRAENNFDEKKLFKAELFGVMKLIENQLKEMEKGEI